ncbi:glycosyltransferase [Alicyclobacillus fastidiosus]|uniref:Glycosyltransferase n=1 Tax=Alicyclobacillus fastidiosus TaxID=392011 RepID=A0ABY6ZAN6_9BACL|nr:glycosyltransferase [Alicyclobacillus fastidiosus]WAH39902.1 glycosyltransferase [Alicyclobacillus fastidiosus]GMA61174.1 hypothetical protein GCM10025859_16140 [Alicyclobacillus fastidiosus]
MSNAHSLNKQPEILVFATQGAESEDARRLSTLCRDLPVTHYQFQKSHKFGSAYALFRHLIRRKPRLVVMEGTGIGGGLAVILGSIVGNVPYVVSSGDAVGPYVGKFHPLLQPIFTFYERILCKKSSGYVGWTPYLAGRALTFGAPRAMTVPGWAPFRRTEVQIQSARTAIRKQLGIRDEDIVIGIVGSLSWNRKVGFCYGYELVKAIQKVHRTDIKVLIVGDGDGKPHLEEAARLNRQNQVIFTGRIPREQVPDYLAAMDLASLPQSMDQVGNFRYTTKISEYLSVKLPVVSGQLPLAYDLHGDFIWRLRGRYPWGDDYVEALTQLLSQMTLEEIAYKRSSIVDAEGMFDQEGQIQRFTKFVTDLLEEERDSAEWPRVSATVT